MKMLLLFLLSGLAFTVPGGIHAAETAPQPAVARTKVDLHSFVNWDFRHRPKLKGWRATATAIQRTLEQCYPARSAHSLTENGTKDALRDFFHAKTGTVH